MNTALEILQKYWGYQSFRKKQDVIIEAVLQKQDVLALLPTGGGKSICYQVPALAMEGTCLVISPLIALMQDQVQQLKKRGIKAVAITSAMSPREIDIQLDNAIYGNTKFLYVSPERLKSRIFKVRFKKMNISLIAIDEAHCISEWGYDFRPAYLDICELKSSKPNTPFLALTATATPEVVIDIQEKLGFKKQNVIFDSFERTNIAYNTSQSNNKTNRILEFLKNRTESGIVYCKTRKNVKNLALTLRDNGVNCAFYHGGLNAKSRSEIQEKWIKNEIQIIVCTNAFGMGIDKPDVRFVLHYDIPETLEAYFQEAGRAGRDEQFAQTELFYEPVDIEKLQESVQSKFPPAEQIKRTYSALGNHFQLAYGSGKDEVFAFDMLEFCDKYKFELITTYNSLRLLQLAQFISLSDEFNSPSRIQFIVSNTELYQFQVRDEDCNKIIQFLLRTHMGIFDDLLAINEKKIASYTGLSEKTITQKLEYLEQNNAIKYIANRKGTFITYTVERLTEENLSLPAALYHKRKISANKKMDAVIHYLNATDCSSKLLLAYFGQENAPDCGICARCKQSKTSISKHLKEDLMDYVKKSFSQNQELEIGLIISELKQHNKDEILSGIRWLLDHSLALSDPLGKKIMKP